jgi:hypothetical protein
MRGVWRRRSIAIDGGPPAKSARVLWLQATEAFADLRVPIDRAEPIEAFAGTTTWAAPRLTWHHTVDWNGGFAGYDCGDITWQEGALVERGLFTDGERTRVYEEIWDRVDDDVPCIVLGGRDAVVVRVGAFSLAVRDDRARGGTFDVRSSAWTSTGGWRDVDVFGAGATLPAGSGTSMDVGWCVIESTPAHARP